MPTEFDRSSDGSTPTHSKDIPPHLESKLTLVLDPQEINKELEEVKGPLEDIPEDIEIGDFEMEE